MKRILLALLLLTTSCSSPVADQAISSFAPCSSIAYKGMAADGTFVECLDGPGNLALEGIEGPAVITVWASWCTTCESQRKNFIRLYNESKGRFQVIGLDVSEKSKSDGYKHALAKGMAYPQLFDPDGRTVSKIAPGIPVTQFKDKNNVITYLQVGPVTKYKDLTTLVEKYLGIKV